MLDYGINRAKTAEEFFKNPEEPNSMGYLPLGFAMGVLHAATMLDARLPEQEAELKQAIEKAVDAWKR